MWLSPEKGLVTKRQILANLEIEIVWLVIAVQSCMLPTCTAVLPARSCHGPWARIMHALSISLKVAAHP